jgi:hypothetical protein
MEKRRSIKKKRLVMITSRLLTKNHHVICLLFCKAQCIKIDSARKFAMDAPEVAAGKLSVDENPQIVISKKLENFTPGIKERDPEFRREPEIANSVHLCI